MQPQTIITATGTTLFVVVVLYLAIRREKRKEQKLRMEMTQRFYDNPQEEEWKTKIT